MLEFEVDKERTEGKSWEDIIERQEQCCNTDSEEEDDSVCIPLDDLSDADSEENKKSDSADDFSLDNTYLVTNYSILKPDKSSKSNNHHLEEILMKSNLTPGLEKRKRVPVSKTTRALKKERKAQREKTKGKDWFNIPATKVTEEIKNDLEILKMRSVLDSKRFYKKNDIQRIPKYFQVGKVVEGAADFYNGRVPKSQRKKTLVEELLADSKFKASQKRKYKEIVDDSRRKKPKRRPEKIEKRSKKSYKDDWLKFD